MKILHVSTPASWRGGEQQAAYLAKGLQAAGIEQAILTPAGSALGKRMADQSIPVISFTSRGLMDVQLARKIASACRYDGFDLIHVHDSHAHSAAVIASAFFGNKTPVVVSRRVDFPVSNNFLSHWKYNHPSVKKIICVSKMIYDITLPAIRDKTKLAVVHSGIDPEPYRQTIDRKILIHELGLKETDKLIGNLSALADHKDYPTFIKTSALTSKENSSCHFIIAGTGPEEEKIKELIKELNVGDKVHMLGFRKDIVAIMKSLDVFLFTSVTEGLGSIVLEAFAAGVPVVATRAGGIPEMVEDGETGLLASPGDAVSLKNAVLRIFQNPSLRQHLVENAVRKVKDFSYMQMAEQTLAIYRSL